VPAQSGAAGWSESERAAAESSGSRLGSVGSRGTGNQPMRPQLRRGHFSRHITFYQHLREGTHGGPRAAGSEAWQAKRQLILPIRPAQRRCGIQNDTQLLRQRRQATRRREIEQGGWKRAFFSILAHLFLQITSANVSVLLLEETSVQCRPARDGGEEPVAGQTRCDQSDK